jgi:integrase
MIQDRINQANGRLKSAKVGVTIQAKGDRLYLVATLPPRPGSDRTRPHQQRIALGARANPAGVQFAEKEARKAGALRDCKQFTWEPYLSERYAPPVTVAEWVERFKAHHRSSVSEVTWDKEYQEVFDCLPQNRPLTVEILQDAICQTTENSRTRKRFCTSLGVLAKFADLDYNFKPLQGLYSSKRVDPRTLPHDQTIAECFHTIKNPAWRWVYGMIATYGLRNHEVFFLDTDDLMKGSHLVTVLEGKTGRRLVWPCYPEWVEEFNLRKPQLPQVTGKKHTDFGHRVSKHFGECLNLPFTAYDMRHRWAVRTLEFGLDISLAAQQMGHSVKVHSETYHHWITADVHQRAFEAMMLRSDRPKAPTVQNQSSSSSS